MTPWTAATVPMAESDAGQSSWRATMVVTASGGGWKDAACAAAVWICRNFSVPSTATSAAMPASMMNILLAIEKPPSALDDAALN